MTLEEFNDYLKTLPYIEAQVVYMRYKYSWQNEWEYSNELLNVDMNVSGYYVWDNDWHEGQEDVEILGCIALSDIKIKTFEREREKPNGGN